MHRAYFEAGADVAITASYHATYEGFAAAGIGREETTRLLRLSVELAQHARDAVRPDGLVAASVGPYGVTFANGTEYTGDYRRSPTGSSRTCTGPRIAALLAAGPDLLAFETIPALGEVAALAELLAEFPGIEAWMTFCCRDGERLSDGTPVEEAVARRTERPASRRSGSTARRREHIGSLLERAAAATDLPLIVYPNSGRAWDGERYEWQRRGGRVLPARGARRAGARAARAGSAAAAGSARPRSRAIAGVLRG